MMARDANEQIIVEFGQWRIEPDAIMSNVSGYWMDADRGVDWCDQDEQARRWSAARLALEAQGGE